MIICNFTKQDFDFRGYHGVPRLIVEVSSPYTSTNDHTWKKDIYEALGVQEYWIVSAADSVSVFNLENGKYNLQQFQAEINDDSLKVYSTIFEGLIIELVKAKFKIWD